LLILQGPAGIERMGWNGQLPAALDSLHRQAGSTCEQARDEEAIASLLAASTERSVTRAIFQLLTLMPSEPPKPAAAPSMQEEPQAAAPTPPSLGDLSQGFFTCRRSRDGPSRIDN